MSRRASAPPSPARSSEAAPTEATPAGATASRSVLRVGQRAEVVYRATPTKANRLGLSVVRVRKAGLRDLAMYVLDHRSAQSRLYYVDVRVTNRARRNAGGIPVRLFGLDTRGVVLPPVRVAGTFAPCETRWLPKRFRSGEVWRTCLVYLVPRHGRLSAVQVRYGKWSGPVTWRVAGQVQ